MTKNYTVDTAPDGSEVIWYEENGYRISFSADPANADYQAYLNKDTLPSNSSIPQAGE
jgi:hypothetical protein